MGEEVKKQDNQRCMFRPRSESTNEDMGRPGSGVHPIENCRIPITHPCNLLNFRDTSPAIGVGNIKVRKRVTHAAQRKLRSGLQNRLGLREGLIRSVLIGKVLNLVNSPEVSFIMIR